MMRIVSGDGSGSCDSRDDDEDDGDARGYDGVSAGRRGQTLLRKAVTTRARHYSEEHTHTDDCIAHRTTIQNGVRYSRHVC